MFDRFDICAAYNLYSQHYGWNDYTRGIQSRLATIRYKPARSEEFLSGLSENALAIYLAVIQKHHGKRAMKAAMWEVQKAV